MAGENLLKDHHLEYMGPYSSILPSMIKRSAYAKIAWRF